MLQQRNCLQSLSTCCRASLPSGFVQHDISTIQTTMLFMSGGSWVSDHTTDPMGQAPIAPLSLVIWQDATKRTFRVCSSWRFHLILS